MRGLLVVLSATLVFAASCAKPPPPSVSMPGSEKVGFVRMDVLIKKHPLYGQLARYDSDIAAMSLRGADPGVPRNAADVTREEADLRRQLNDAADKTQKFLRERQLEYAQKERTAIQAAIGGPAPAAGSGGAAVAGQVNSTYQNQARTVSAQANKNYRTYSDAVIAEDKRASDAVAKTLASRADRSYRSRVDEVQQKEADLSLKLATEDSAARLELKTKLTNLALDDAAREETKAKLAALDRKEADAMAAVRNRDQAMLEAYQTQLRTQTQAQIRSEIQKVHAGTATKLRSRENTARAEVAQKIGSLGPGVPQTLTVGPSGKATIPPDLRAKVEGIHKQYYAQYQHDYDQSLAQYNKTRDELSRRFAALHGADGGAQASARTHIDQLQKQRNALFEEIVAQIRREVKTVALAHGVRVVLTDLVGSGGGVDLTAAAQKDIETLHE